MSCGNPHDVDCRDVLDRVYTYLDNELQATDCAEIRQHLDECAPCLREFGLEQEIKALVYRCCGHDEVPSQLRTKVMARIEEVRGEGERAGGS